MADWTDRVKKASGFGALSSEQVDPKAAAIGQKVADYGRAALGSMNPRRKELSALPTQSQPNPAIQSARKTIAGKPAVPLSAGGAWNMTDQPVLPSVSITSMPDMGPSAPAPQEARRTLSMGTQGQDGYGKVTVTGGKGGNGFAQFSPQRQIRGGGNGYYFEGSAGDAAKFFAPVSRPAPTAATLGMQGGDYRQVRAAHEAGKVAQQGVPQYLGPESGLGWKTRAKLYDTQMDAYNKATSNKAQMDIAAMQEAGAGRRSLLQAQGINDRNAIDAARLVGDQGLQAVEMQGKRAELGHNKVIADARAKLAGLEPGTPEFARQERLLAGLSGQYKETTPKYQTLDKFDAEGNRIGQTLYDQTTGKIVEQGGAKFESAPTDPAKRVPGTTYETPKGPLKWNGKAWEDPT